MDLGTGAYLRADTTRSLDLCHCLSHWLPRCPQTSTSLCQAGGALDARAESWIRSCCAPAPAASLGHQRPKPLRILSSLPSISLIPRIFSHFQDLPSSVFNLWDHLLTEIFGFWDKLFSPELQALGFPNLSGPCGEAWCVISLLLGGSVSWLFINWGIQVVLLFFSSCIIKICKQTIPASSKFPLQSSKVWFWIVTCPHTCPVICCLLVFTI